MIGAPKEGRLVQKNFWFGSIKRFKKILQIVAVDQESRRQGHLLLECIKVH